jgi:hypothetical protein
MIDDRGGECFVPQLIHPVLCYETNSGRSSTYHWLLLRPYTCCLDAWRCVQNDEV